MFYNYNISSNWCDSLNLRLSYRSFVENNLTWPYSVRPVVSLAFLMVYGFCRVKINILLQSPTNDSFTPTVPPSDDLKTAARRDVVRFTCVRLMMNCLWLNIWIKSYLTTAATLIRLYNNIETLFPVGRKSAGRMSQIRTRTSKTLHNGSGLQYHALTSLPLQCLCCVSRADD